MRLLDPALQAFIAVAKYKTVHAAAAVICLTQTGVTQRIKNLEKRLGTSLFIRSRRGMLLTDEGETLLRFCQSFQAIEGEALTSITRAGIEKNIQICISGPTTIMHSRIIPRCINVMKQFPKLLIQFDINDNEVTRVQALKNGDSQLAILDQNHLADEMEYKELHPLEYVLVASHQWKNRKLTTIIKNEKIIDFAPHDQLTFNYLKQHNLLKLANKDRHFINRTHSLLSLIAEGVGYGLLPLEFAKPYLDKELYVFNKGKTYRQHFALAWFPRNPQPAYFAMLIKACV